MATALIRSFPTGASLAEHDVPLTPTLLPRQIQNFGLIPVEMENAIPYSALPERVLFGALRHPALKLRKPILLQTERSETGINVVWEETQEFGSGETFSSAIDDFGITLAELYFQLEESDSPLSDYLQGIRNKLADYVEVRPQ